MESCGLQWKQTVGYIKDSLNTISAERVLQVRYEDFISRPIDTMQRVGEVCHLEWTDPLREQVAEGLRSRNYKWSESFSPSEIELLQNLQGDLMAELGYTV